MKEMLENILIVIIALFIVWMLFFGLSFISDFDNPEEFGCDPDNKCDVFYPIKPTLTARLNPLFLLFGHGNSCCEHICWNKIIEVCDGGVCYRTTKLIYKNEEEYNKR